MQLKQGTLLQGGKYRIERMLGQGGFGITYLATQDILDRKVAIKEFFFKEYCERDENTNTVTLGTQSNKTTVERFLKKFIKEAKTISTLRHPNIIQIHDIFRENNTAYYVMEYIDGKSLGDIVKEKGAFPEFKAVEYIKKTADALSYIHARNINHLDVKPNNIMLRNSDGEIVLIDFGVAKQYDETTKEGTTTTPVGISHGYSPSEQYKRNGVSSFSPESDIYSLGATLYKLVTGITPPEAIEVAQEGLPPMSSTISEACQATIKRSMKLNKADRPHNIAEFVEILTPQIKEPEIIVEVIKEETVIPSITQNQKKPQTSVAENYNNERTSNNSSNERTSRNQQDAKSNKEIKKPQEPHVSGKIGGGKPRPLNKLYVGVGVAALIAIVSVGIYMYNQPSPGENGAGIPPITLQTPDSTAVEKFEYKDLNGKLLYYWTGSIDKAQKPGARGIAVYPSNDKDGRKSYVGEMKNGLRDGENATLTYTNGNVYKGSFYNDKLSNGRLDLTSDGMYYIGTFKNDNPYNGKWYYTNGTLYSTVINGVEK